MVATNIQVPNMEALGKLSPGGEVIICLHSDKRHIGVALRVWQEGVFTRVLAVVQNLGLTEQSVNFHFISFFLQTEGEGETYQESPSGPWKGMSRAKGHTGKRYSRAEVNSQGPRQERTSKHWPSSLRYPPP